MMFITLKKICTLCKFVTVGKENFVEHLSKHDTNDPSMKKCSFCAMEFLSRERLQSHALMHFRKFPFWTVDKNGLYSFCFINQGKLDIIYFTCVHNIYAECKQKWVTSKISNFWKLSFEWIHSCWQTLLWICTYMMWDLITLFTLLFWVRSLWRGGGIGRSCNENN